MKKSTLFLCMAMPSLLLTACGGDSGSGSSTQPQTAVQKALESGDASLVSDANEFISASESLVSDLNRQYNQIKSHLLQGENGQALSGLHWDPTHDTAIITPTYGFNDTILKTNKAMIDGYADQELVIGVAGYTSSQTRYAALASNPFRTQQRFPDSVNDQMETWLENLVSWAVGSDTPEKIVLAQLDQSYYFPDDGATRDWIKNNINPDAEINDDDACDADKLKSCLDDKPDLLIISQKLNDGDNLNDVVEGLKYAFEHQIPVLYLHLDGGMTELGHALFAEMHIQYVGDNYWRKLGLSDWNPSQLLDQIPDFIVAEQALLKRLKDDSFNVELKLCDDKSCTDESLMDDEFYQAANTIRTHLNNLDKQKVDLFATSDYEYEKLILLLADSYRQGVTYPMDKNNTEQIDFLKSYFSDYVQYQSRTLNAAQPSLGNFSTKTFEDVQLINKTVTLESKRNFRSAGLYALPGQTIKVTRVDSNDVSTSIAFNSLRSGATHEFSKDGGYARPKFLTSVAYSVDPGETITLTSAYGGTLQVHFDKNDINVELKFENVARPVIRHQRFHGMRADPCGRGPGLGSAGFVVTEVLLGQQRDILAAVAERRQL